MSEANALFTLDGCDLIIQCSKEDKMRDICQKYATKVNENLNSLLFLYGGGRINFELKFNTVSLSTIVFVNTSQNVREPSEDLTKFALDESFWRFKK